MSRIFCDTDDLRILSGRLRTHTACVGEVSIAPRRCWARLTVVPIEVARLQQRAEALLARLTYLAAQLEAAAARLDREACQWEVQERTVVFGVAGGAWSLRQWSGGWPVFVAGRPVAVACPRLVAIRADPVCTTRYRPFVVSAPFVSVPLARCDVRPEHFQRVAFANCVEANRGRHLTYR